MVKALNWLKASLHAVSKPAVLLSQCQPTPPAVNRNVMNIALFEVMKTN
jgi:hypothetical protein